MRKKLKTTLVIVLLTACCISCQKNVDYSYEEMLISNIRSQVVDSLSDELKEKIDFGNIVLYEEDTDGSIARIPFKELLFENEFLLLHINANGSLLRGRIVKIEQDRNEIFSEASAAETGLFQGSITLLFLSGSMDIRSRIWNGYILQDSTTNSRISTKDIDVRPPAKEISYKVLPDIIITSNNSSGGVSASTWYSLNAMLGSSSGSSSISGAGNGRSAAYYSASYTGSADEKKHYQTKDGQIKRDQRILVDFELPPKKVITIDAYLHCFSLIPDAGADCSIELFTDIPVDGNPMKSLNPKTGSPGHTFLQITKSNNGEIITQNLGFYPESPSKVLLTTAPVKGVFADNELHEYNASIKMKLSPQQFNTVINTIKKLSKGAKYDLDDYNCTDFALQAFNSVRGMDMLEIPRMNIPGALSPQGSNTPQGLYLKLEEMKSRKVGVDNISIPEVKGFVGRSHGTCN